MEKKFKSRMCGDSLGESSWLVVLSHDNHRLGGNSLGRRIWMDVWMDGWLMKVGLEYEKLELREYVRRKNGKKFLVDGSRN